MEKGQKVELNSWEVGGLVLPVPPPPPPPTDYIWDMHCLYKFLRWFSPSFIIGDQARYWCSKMQEERKKATCEQYAKAFDSEEVLYPYHYVDKNWPAEKYSGGCYVSIMPCGVMTNFWKALREPVGRVHFAGTETATVWSGKRCSTNHPTELRSYTKLLP